MFKQSKSFSDSQELINLVSSKNFNCVDDLITFIELRNYNSRQLNLIVDSYDNNLLHLAVMNSNPRMTEYLLEKGLDYSKKK